MNNVHIVRDGAGNCLGRFENIREADNYVIHLPAGNPGDEIKIYCLDNDIEKLCCIYEWNPDPDFDPEDI